MAFKPKTNDMREAPAITIINMLLEKGAKIKAFDPKALSNAKKILGEKITYTASAYEALEGVDALLLLTEWNEFRFPDTEKMKKPSFLMVLTAVGKYAYQREDGVYVIPIGCLKG